MADTQYTPTPTALKALAKTYGEANALGDRARWVGSIYDAAAKTNATPPTRDALAALIGEQRAASAYGKRSDYTPAMLADAAKALTPSPATISQARAAYDVVTSADGPRAHVDTAAMTTAAEALALGAKAADLKATAKGIAGMPEAKRSEALAEALADAKGRAAEARRTSERTSAAERARIKALTPEAKAVHAATRDADSIIRTIESLTKRAGESEADAKASAEALTRIADVVREASTKAKAEAAKGRKATTASPEGTKATPATVAKRAAKGTPAKAPAEAAA
jgi:hypothetical protein